MKILSNGGILYFFLGKSNFSKLLASYFYEERWAVKTASILLFLQGLRWHAGKLLEGLKQSF